MDSHAVRWSLILAAALLAPLAGRAWAVVNCTPSVGITLTQPATLAAPRDRSFGTFLSNWNASANTLVETGCTATDTSTTWLQGRGTLTPTGKSVAVDGRTHPIFATSLRGVGLILAVKDTSGGWYAADGTATDLIKGWSTQWGALASVRLVATGEPIQSGSLPAIQVGEFYVTEKSSGTSTKPAPVYITATSFTAQTCSVDASSVNIPVDLATTSSSKLHGQVGTTDGSASFSVRLNCTAGVNVYMTLSDANNLGNTSDTLTLSPSPVQAKGVGIQVRRNGTPVRFGPDSSVAGNTNQIALGASPNGVLNIPFTVNYIKTEATVRPGEANAVATYTLSYQ